MQKECTNPECRAANREDADFCFRCGQSFSAPRYVTLPGSGRAGGTVKVVPQTVTLAKGTKIDRWIIGDVLGRGGMGVVYLARHDFLDSAVALKVLSPVLSFDPNFQTRFEQEARIQARLRHPNIAKLQDHGKQDGQLYTVIEYLEGGTLADLIRNGPVKPVDALRWTREALSGLEYAHGENVVHRDITASNIMLDDRGVSKVGDFGIALMPGGRRLTNTGAPLGVRQYMSPEQIREHTGVDRRSDIYSMGIVLYELLTGRLPFEDAQAATDAAYLNTSPPSPRSFNEAIPEELERIVLTAIEKDPNHRYQTCAQFANALKAFDDKQVPSATVVIQSTDAVWVLGSEQAIRWTAAPGFGRSLVNTKIELFRGPEVLCSHSVDAASGQGLFQWKLPASGLATGEYQLRIVVQNDEKKSVEVVSPARITIAQQKSESGPAKEYVERSEVSYDFGESVAQGFGDCFKLSLAIGGCAIIVAVVAAGLGLIPLVGGYIRGFISIVIYIIAIIAALVEIVTKVAERRYSRAGWLTGFAACLGLGYLISRAGGVERAFQTVMAWLSQLFTYLAGARSA